MRGFSRPRHVPRIAPVTLISIHVDPVEAPVFRERQVYPPRYAPKAARSPLSEDRLEKGIRNKLTRRTNAIAFLSELSGKRSLEPS